MRRAALGLALGLTIGCARPAAEPPPPAAPPPAPVEPSEPRVVEVTVDPMVTTWRELDQAKLSAMGPSQPGFVFCCGDGNLKIEIACDDMIKRCYEKRGARWRATYGRHCKSALGEACYLEECEARCR